MSARLPLLATLGLAGTLAGAPALARAQIVSGGSFESPTIGANSFQYRPSGAAWTFAENSGLVNGTGGNFLAPAAPPAGSQAAFLQVSGAGTSRIAQSVTLGSAGTYRLTFQAAGRTAGGNFGGNMTFDAFLGSQLLGSTVTTSGQLYSFRTYDFTASAGTYDLAFAQSASATGDNAAFIDDVRIESVSANVVPEPSTYALFGAGLLALGGAARRRRRTHA